MKAKTALILFYVAALMVGGCIPSLHPLYTDETLIFDENLIGKWMPVEENEGDFGIWQFSKAGDNEYELKILQGKVGRFVAHLLELDGKTYLDLYPGEEETLENLNDTYKIHLVPAHTFMRIYQTDPNLQLQWLGIEDTLKDDPNLLKHEKINDDIVLTASTDELQEFVIEHANDLAEEPAEFTRLEPLFSEDDFIFEEKLVGIWQSEEEVLDSAKWDEGNGYDMIFIDKDNTEHKFYVRSVKLKDIMMLAVYFSEPSDNEIECGLHLIPDFFVVVDQIEPKLLLREVEYKELSELLKQNTVNLKQQDTEIDYIFEGTRIEP